MKEEFRDLVVENLDEANVLLCGIPFDKNASVGKGAKEAPKVLRELSFDLPPLDRKGFLLKDIKLYDFGDFVSEDFDELKCNMLEFLKHEGFHIVFGGDHSIAIATNRAFYDKCKALNKTPVLIHIDAHPDICDEYHNSKYSHACPVKRAIDYGYEDKNVTLCGIRGFEEQEIETFKKHPLIDVFKANDIKEMGYQSFIEILKRKYKGDSYLFYISYDIDANDPAYAPGTGTPEAFGLSNFETMGIITGIVENFNVDIFEIVEVAPPLDVNNITSWLALKTLYEVFASLIQTKKLIK